MLIALLQASGSGLVLPGSAFVARSAPGQAPLAVRFASPLMNEAEAMAEMPALLYADTYAPDTGPPCCTYQRHRAACSWSAKHGTCAVRVPAPGVPCVPRHHRHRGLDTHVT